MAEDSTPLNTESKVDTSNVATIDTPASENNAEPTAATNEPIVPGDKAENDTTNSSPKEELIFGKFKTLDEAQKSYKEAERAITKAADLEKQLKAYQDRENQARQQREIEARELGFSDAEEREFNREVIEREFKRYCEALETKLTGDVYTKAYQALYAYQQTGNRAYLEAARSYFSPETVASIAKDIALFEEGHRNEQLSKHTAAQKQKLEAFARENADWIQAKSRQDALGLIIQVSGGNVDFAAAKKAIDALEEAAIAEWKKTVAENSENQNLQNSLQTPTAGLTAKDGRKWLTKEQYMNMSDAEEAANRDLIREQILLEKEGALPRQLTA